MIMGLLVKMKIGIEPSYTRRRWGWGSRNKDDIVQKKDPFRRMGKSIWGYFALVQLNILV